MGLILEIRQKSRIIIEPELDVSPEDYHKLKVGECTIAKDEKVLLAETDEFKNRQRLRKRRPHYSKVTIKWRTLLISNKFFGKI
jgi:hypothetical protein